MVVLGHDSTVPATIDEMLILTRAVNARRAPAARRRRPAVRLVPGLRRAGARERDPLREGGRRRRRQARGRRADALARARDRRRRTSRVMGHVGLTPQSATMLGGFKAQGRTADAGGAAATRTRSRCRRRAASRSCSRRCRRRSRRAITEALEIPTIGIGAGAGCDGQVLVWHDLLGLYEGHAPRFVKQYAELAPTIGDAVARYAAEVRDGRVPGGAAHLRDPRRRARALRGGARA